MDNTHSHADLYSERTQTIADLSRLENEASDIKGQLDLAAMRRSTTGEGADPEWFHKASAARRIKLSQIRQLQTRLAEINAALRVENIQENKPVEGVSHRRRLKAALVVCREALKVYDEDDTGHPLTRAIDDLDEVFPEWEDALEA